MGYRKLHVDGVEYKYTWGKKFLKVRGLPPVDKDFLRIFHYCEDDDLIYGEYVPQHVVDFIKDHNKTGTIPSNYRQEYLRGARVDWYEVLKARSLAGKCWDD